MDRHESKIFDRSAYSKTTISVYQIVSAYLVDVYYNHLYAEAIKFKSDGKVSSVTEGYRHATWAFLSTLDNKAKKTYKAEHYNRLLQGINEYFIFWTTYSSLTISECISKIVAEFVPADYGASLDKDQRRNILRTVLIDTIREFTKVVLGEYLGAIIDNHEEIANVEALKDRMVDLFIVEREKMFMKFMDCRTGGDAKNEKVDLKFAEKLRSEIIRLNDENSRLTRDNEILQRDLSVRVEQLSGVIQRYKKMESMYRSIVDEYKISKEKISHLEDALRSRHGNGNGNGNSRVSDGDDDDDDADDTSAGMLSSSYMPQAKPQPQSRPQPQQQQLRPMPTVAPAPAPATQPAKPTMVAGGVGVARRPPIVVQPTAPQIIPKATVAAALPSAPPSLSKQVSVKSADESDAESEKNADKSDADAESESDAETTSQVLPSKKIMDAALATHSMRLDIGTPSSISDIF